MKILPTVEDIRDLATFTNFTENYILAAPKLFVNVQAGPRIVPYLNRNQVSKIDTDCNVDSTV